MFEYTKLRSKMKKTTVLIQWQMKETFKSSWMNIHAYLSTLEQDFITIVLCCQYILFSSSCKFRNEFLFLPSLRDNHEWNLSSCLSLSETWKEQSLLSRSILWIQKLPTVTIIFQICKALSIHFGKCMRFQLDWKFYIWMYINEHISVSGNESSCEAVSYIIYRYANIVKV